MYLISVKLANLRSTFSVQKSEPWPEEPVEEPVPWETERVCEEVPQTKCEVVPREVCHKEEHEVCQDVERDDCHTVPECKKHKQKKCWLEPKEKCVKLPKKGLSTATVEITYNETVSYFHTYPPWSRTFNFSSPCKSPDSPYHYKNLEARFKSDIDFRHYFLPNEGSKIIDLGKYYLVV